MNILRRVKGRIESFVRVFFVRLSGVVVGEDARIYGGPIFSGVSNSNIVFGRRVVLCSDSEFTALGVVHPVVFRVMRPGARISVGDDCGFSGNSVCCAQSIEIGNRCLFGSGAMVFDTDFHPRKVLGRRFSKNWDEIACASVKIEDDVFVGANAIILKGVTIGCGSIVGAGAVVGKSVPPFSIVAGNPALVVGKVET